MQRLSALAALLVLIGPAAAQTPGTLTVADRLSHHALATAGPIAIFTTSAAAGIRQWMGEPHEWGHGMAGYGRRVGYYTANRGANNAIQFAAGSLLREDPRYFPSGDGTWRRRTRHALVRTFLITKPSGAASFAYSRMLGSYGGGFLANLWYPDRMRTPGGALLRGTISLAGEAGGNVFREFWPSLKKRLLSRHRKRS